jgi:hypothetical protein
LLFRLRALLPPLLVVGAIREERNVLWPPGRCTANKDEMITSGQCLMFGQKRKREREREAVVVSV